MQPPYKADRSLILMAFMIGVSQEGKGRSISSNPFVFPDKKRNMIICFLVVDVSLDLGAGFPILALTLPVEEVSINGVVLIHCGRGEILFRFIKVYQEDIRLFVFEIFDALSEFRRQRFCKISKCRHNLVCVVLAMQIQRACERVFINA